MADHSTCLPITPDSIERTYERINSHIHATPLLTCRSLNAIASHPDPISFLSDDPPSVWKSPPSPIDDNETPKFNLYFKMESTQLIGAFKARGAFSAITHLASPPDDPSLPGIGIDALRKRGVITHSSGNHAQALALAASSLNIPATIVMPSISTKSKISGTKNTPGVEVVFSGSTAPEREQKVSEVIEEKKKRAASNGDGNGGNQGPILVPPYDHPDIMLGQGTTGYEMEKQFQVMKASSQRKACNFAVTENSSSSGNYNGDTDHHHENEDEHEHRFDAVITPLGGGGLLSGTATWFSHTSTSASTSNSTSPNNSNTNKKTLVFGAEPRHQGANDGERALAQTPPKRIPHVSTLTIADGLRTPIGIHPWSIISNKNFVEGVHSVSETQIKMALKLVLERLKVVIEPSAAVPLAVVLFNRRFRALVARMQGEEKEARREQRNGERRAWDVGIVVSGGNTTVEALSRLFGEGWLDGSGEEEEDENGLGERKAESSEFRAERETGEVGRDGRKVAEDVAG